MCTMAAVPTLPSLGSSFLSSSLHPKFTLSQTLKPPRTRRSPTYPRVRALELDQNAVFAISVGVLSVAVGIGIPVFYETQIDNAAKRENTQPCFPCNGSGARKGTVAVVVGGGETEVSQCINCEGAGTLTCTTCQGSGIQPRYLDRRVSASVLGKHQLQPMWEKKPQKIRKLIKAGENSTFYQPVWGVIQYRREIAAHDNFVAVNHYNNRTSTTAHV